MKTTTTRAARRIHSLRTEICEVLRSDRDPAVKALMVRELEGQIDTENARAA